MEWICSEMLRVLNLESHAVYTCRFCTCSLVAMVFQWPWVKTTQVNRPAATTGLFSLLPQIDKSVKIQENGLYKQVNYIFKDLFEGSQWTLQVRDELLKFYNFFPFKNRMTFSGNVEGFCQNVFLEIVRWLIKFFFSYLIT